jgi:hypothetical protein
VAVAGGERRYRNRITTLRAGKDGYIGGLYVIEADL